LHPSLIKNDIRLGFVEMLDANRPSGAHSVAIVSLVAEDFRKGVDQVLVVVSVGSHAKDLAIKEFDSFFWPENAGLRHPVILVDRKLQGSGFDGFGEKGLHGWFVKWGAGEGRNPVQKQQTPTDQGGRRARADAETAPSTPYSGALWIEL